MLNLLFDFLPILLFFIAFQWYGIYVATTVGIVVTVLQWLISSLWMRRVNHKQLVNLVVFSVFGGMTLYFHNPMFIKWKPTIIFWFFAALIVVQPYFSKTPFIQYLLRGVLPNASSVPAKIWQNLTCLWSSFFIALGLLNVLVAYTLSTAAWVSFKLYGILGIFFIFALFQAAYLSRYVQRTSSSLQ